MVATIALLVTACGDSGDDDVVTSAEDTSESTASDGTGAPDGESAGETTELCSRWAAVYDGEDGGLNAAFFAELERVAPESLTDDVVLVDEVMEMEEQARSEGGEIPDVEGAELESLSRVMAWVGTQCTTGQPVGPPLDAVPAGLTVCGATIFPDDVLDGFDEMGQATVYAPADAQDPFTGDVLMLQWGSSGNRGDGETTPVELRAEHGATDAVVAPITVFQQVVPQDLGTVVAWTEDGLELGLYRRGWSLDRADELVAIAEEIQRIEGETDTGRAVFYEIPHDALPSGFTELVTGSAATASPMALSNYTITFNTGDEPDDPTNGATGLVTLSGSPSDGLLDELWRMFTLGSERIEVDGTTVSFSDSAWSDAGPVIASWRIGDGRVTVMGMSVPTDVVLDVVRASRELTDEEWMELASIQQYC